MACPGDDTISAFLAGRLAAGAQAEAHAHLDACPTCQELIAAIGRGSRALGTGREAHLSAGAAEAGACGAAPLAPGSSVQRYVILGLLGAGGMGVVYAAYDPELDRRVALKLLRLAQPDGTKGTNGAQGTEGAPRWSAAAQRALLREAQAIARLAHPNVVAVHDVGEIDGAVFVTMEYVDGVTLRDWLAERPRTAAEIVPVFVQAGRGLAAAHAAGLVHRDFKPSNVMVGRDGRVRVLDFGLALGADEASPGAGGGGGGGGAAGTVSGRVAGTPAYMAPEQHRGERAGVAADQFSFCVALFEALHGARPFPGGTSAELSASMASGRPTIPAGAPGVPDRIAAALRRGLSVEPAARFPSMEALLGAIDHSARPARRRRIAVIGFAAGAVLAGSWLLVGGGEVDPTATLCTGAAERLNGVWDDSTRAHVEAAFRATGLPYAQRTSVLTAERLDRWAKDWTAAHEDTCAATAIHKEQPTEVEALRRLCLDRRRIEVEALVRRLNGADATIVERAARAVEELAPVAACADLGALTAVVPPPSDPARQAEIGQIERELAEIEALRRTGDARSIGARIAQLVARAQAIGWRPLEASALFLDADVAGRIGVPAQEVEAKLHLAARAAAEARDDARLARAWSSLVGLLGNDPRRRADAELFEGYARAILGRLAVRAEAELDLASARCDRNVPSASGADEIAEAARAEADCRDVIARAERIDPPRPETAAGALLRVAHFLRVQGKRDEARETILRAVRWNEELFGAASPGVADARHALATSLLTEKKVDEAIAELKAVLALRRVLYPEGGVKLGESLQGLGDALSSAPHPERALPYLREARDVFARAEGTTGVQAPAGAAHPGRGIQAGGR